MNKLVLGCLLVCCANPALAQMPASEELPAVAGTQSNSATTTLQDVSAPPQTAAAQPQPPASAPATTPVPANDIDAVINNVVNDTTPDDASVKTGDATTLGDAPAAEIPLEETPAQELQDDPMQPQKFAVLGTLDKVTGRTATLNVPVDKVMAVGPLFLQVKACQKASAFANQPENAAFIQVWQSDDAEKSKATSWVFSGWMFASSPSLSAMDHPVYDVWVIDCKNANKAQK